MKTMAEDDGDPIEVSLRASQGRGSSTAPTEDGRLKVVWLDGCHRRPAPPPRSQPAIRFVSLAACPASASAHPADDHHRSVWAIELIGCSSAENDDNDDINDDNDHINDDNDHINDDNDHNPHPTLLVSEEEIEKIRNSLFSNNNNNNNNNNFDFDFDFNFDFDSIIINNLTNNNIINNPLNISLAFIKPIPLSSILLRINLPSNQPRPIDHLAILPALERSLQPPRIIRQSDKLILNTEYAPLAIDILLTEPVLQGILSSHQTCITIINIPSPSTTLHQYQHQHQHQHKDIHPSCDIDPDFLAHSILDKPLSSINSSFPAPHPFYPLPLSSSSPSSNLIDPSSLDHSHLNLESICFVRTCDLIKIGVLSGDWVLLTTPSSDNQTLPKPSHRLLRIIASDHHPDFIHLKRNHPSYYHRFTSHPDRSSSSPPGLVFLSPILLFNLIGTISYSDAIHSSSSSSHPHHQPTIIIIPTGLPSHLDPHQSLPLPIIKSLTLARLASPQALTKSYQPHFLRNLKHFFELRSRVLLPHDLIPIPIDRSSTRFTDVRRDSTHPESSDELDPDHVLPSSTTSYPTTVVYFKVTDLELSCSVTTTTTTSENKLNRETRQNPIDHHQTTINQHLQRFYELIEDGLLGGIVDPKVTQLVQTGLEFGFVPDAKHWLGINALSPLFHSSPSNTSIYSRSAQRSLYEYFLAASRIESRDYDLNLTILISGPRGSGKSTIVNRVADATGFNFLDLNCFDLLAETELKTSATLKVKFERALQSVPCVILLRHLEGLARRSQTLESGGQLPSVLGTLKDCLQEARSREHSIHEFRPIDLPLIIVGTTSQLDSLPLGVLALFKTQLSIEPPSEVERLEILKELLRRESLAPDINLKSIALETAGLVAKDLVHLITQARMAAISRIMDHQIGIDGMIHSGIQLMAKDIEKAIGKARSEYSESIGAPRIPKVSWDDIGGLAKVKEEILETVELPIQHPELFKSGLKKRSGILLYGPPGTGKTLLAKAVATSCGLNFFSVKGPELLNMYIGESEANVRRVFEKARGARPCVIFFDELDSVAPKRGNQGDSGGVMDRIVSQLLAELDGISSGSGGSHQTDETSKVNQDDQGSNGNNGSGGGGGDISDHDHGEVVVIGATNRPDLLDPALLRPGRFDKLIYLGIPNTKQEKLEILKSLTRKFKLNKEFSFDWLIDQISSIHHHHHHHTQQGEEHQKEDINLLTGADYYSICSEALMANLNRKIERLENKKQRKGSDKEAGDDDDDAKKLVRRASCSSSSQDDDEEQDEVNQQDFLIAINSVKPSISLDELNHYRSIQSKFQAQTSPQNQNPNLSKSVDIKGKSKLV